MKHEVIVDGVRYMPMPTEEAQALQDEAVRMQAALDVRFESDANDDHDLSLREYLRGIVELVWELGEDFSGKRLFGNGGWRWSVYGALVGAGFIEGSLSENGLIKRGSVDEVAAHEFVAKLIRGMCDASPPSGAE